MNLKIAGIVFVAIGLLGFFLPWIKPMPLEPQANRLDVSRKMMAHDPERADVIYDYILMNGLDAREAVSSPAEGVSGFQLAMARSSRGLTGMTAACLADNFFGDRKVDWRIKTLWILPTLTLLGLATLLFPYGRIGTLFISLALIGVYGLVRWEITKATNIYLEASYGIGLWLSLYAAVLLGITCLIHAIAPGGKSSKSRSR